MAACLGINLLANENAGCWAPNSLASSCRMRPPPQYVNIQLTMGII